MERKIEYYDPKFEQMAKEELLEFQFREFKREVQKAWEQNAFYKKKFTEAGIYPDDIQTREDIIKLPVTTKEDLLRDIAEYPPYGSRLQVPTSEIAMVVETSGSSGRGQEVHAFTTEDLDRNYTMLAHIFFWAGMRKGTVMMQPWPVTLLAAARWWDGATQKLGSNMFHLGNYDTRERLRIMKRFRAEVIFADPAYLRRLEYVADEMGMDVKKDIGAKGILTIAGGASLDWAAEREEKWGAKVYELYGTTQRAITCTCEYGMLHHGKWGLIHWLPHLCVIEVVNPATGKHVAPGEEGEIINTPLGSQATPLIRFITKDKGKYLTSEQCSCGRPFDGFEAASIGRLDDMLKIKGINIWQSAVDNCVLTHPGVLEYKAEIFIDDKGREQVCVLMEFHRDVPNTNKQQSMAQIGERLRANTGINFLVKELSGPSIFEQRDKTSQQKVRRWEDKRYITGSAK